MSAPIVISGPAAWNRIVYLDHLPEPVPHMQFALDDYETIGGTSAGKALGLAGLGRPVLLHTLLGDDDEGRRVQGALEASGVALASLAAARTESHLNLMTRQGERVSLYLSAPADPGTPPSPDLTQAMADAPAIVLDLSERSRGLIGAARATGRPIWTDIHDYDGSADFHRPFIEAADWIFMNADRIGVDPLPFMEACVRGGASVVVCTLGAQGAIAVSRGGGSGAGDGERMSVTEVAAVPVEVLDTNGAGDAFMAGVLDAHLGGASLVDALAAGSRHAATVLTTRHLHPVLERVL
ncbi:carbohydrate kinase family protein [Agromyces cerinus]|uniref:Sugar or nucleoside kinase, ribokinase family n=1 Tax=Agromyces cerinus subsp. cerinus TaxID=232089 RepID=A0A1N6G5U6_9MICO|nr:carbohydrate kinase family protein [Agromyces cerinus]SIO02916.1 Sugar or nucleoside kinase, ribokinase family [Agromyces cerinus subsp. cerinus]